MIILWVGVSRRASTCAAVHPSVPNPSSRPVIASSTPPDKCATTSCTDHSGHVGTIVDARTSSRPPTRSVMRALQPAYAAPTSPITHRPFRLDVVERVRPRIATFRNGDEATDGHVPACRVELKGSLGWKPVVTESHDRSVAIFDEGHFDGR